MPSDHKKQQKPKPSGGSANGGPAPSALDQLLDRVEQEELKDVLCALRARDPEQSEFLDAVAEVASSLEPVFAKRPELVGAFRQLCEPERQVAFRVAWLDDDNKVRVNRGFRVHVSSALGPGKGGLRFNPKVSLSVIKMLGFEQAFKNALTTLPMGAAKGGSDFDPKGKSPGEVQRFCQAFMTELARHIGPDVDVPAGDQGVGPREIGWLYGQYKRVTMRAEGVLTGKGLSYGGSYCRPEATGHGVVMLAEEMLKDSEEEIKGKRCLVSGGGNVALHCARRLVRDGAVVLTVSDSKGTLLRKEGWTEEQLDEAAQVKGDRNRSLSELEKDGAEYFEGATPWRLDGVDKVDLAFPCATQNELDEDDAEALADKGCAAVVEGANMPCTAAAAAALRARGVAHAPGKMANAGGVAVSGLEMAQNRSMVTWSAEEVYDRLKDIMAQVYAQARDAAKEHDCSLGDGANIAAFEKLSAAILAQGAV